MEGSPEDRLTALEDRLTTLETDFDKLRTDHSRFVSNFTPGSKFLLQLLFKKVYDKTLSVTAAQHLIPGVAGTHGPFDIATATDPNTAEYDHAFYLLSARVGTNGTFVIYQGTSISVNGCSVALARYRTANKDQTWLDVYNSTAGTVAINVKVYRILGFTEPRRP